MLVSQSGSFFSRIFHESLGGFLDFDDQGLGLISAVWHFPESIALPSAS
jgi:hypothetical protein